MATRYTYIVRFLPLLLLAMSFLACSDDVIVSPGESPTTHEFQIMMVTPDSVMWEDTVDVLVRNAETDSFKVFVHTMQMNVIGVQVVDSIATVIRFIVPQNASTGFVRVFERDTIQATGEKTLRIYPRARSWINPRASSFEPRQGYAGDLIIIKGQDLHYVRDISVKLAAQELPIVSRDSAHVIVRLPHESTSGEIRVKLDQKNSITLGVYTKLVHSGSFLPSNTLSTLVITGEGLTGTTRVLNRDDSLQTTIDKIPPLTMVQFHYVSTIERKGDSLIILTPEDQWADTKLELRLKFEPDHRVSGIVRAWGRVSLDKKAIDLDIKGMRWGVNHLGNYIIYSRSVEIKDQMPMYKQMHDQNAARTISTTETYTGGSVEAYVEIAFDPE